MQQIDLLPKQSILLSCIRQGQSLRVKVESAGYRADWFCAFPRSLRREGARYLVERLTPVRGHYYRVSGAIVEVRSMTATRRAQQEFSMEYDGGIVTGSNEAAVRAAVAQMNGERKRAQERDRVFPGEVRDKMSTLCRKFPTLSEAPIAPWDTDQFLLWVVLSAHCSAAYHASRFVLSIWNTSTDWVDLVRREASLASPENPRDRALWDGLQQLRKKAREHLEALVRHDVWEYGRPVRAVSTAAVDAQLLGWLDVLKPFSVAAAFAVWDEEHRAAFRAWTQHPFFP